MATKRIQINFRANGEGTLIAGGTRYPCLGKGPHPDKGPGARYPRDLTVTPRNKYTVKYSNEFVTATGPNGSYEPARMPYAILIWGQRGIYIHSWPSPPTLAGNGGPTAGCIHLSTVDAPRVFNYVDTKTRITISYPW